MIKVLKFLLKVILAIIILIVAAFLIIFGIRKYNEIKYRSYKIDSGGYLSPTDLSQYNTDIEGVEVSRVTGEYINGFRLKPHNKTHKGVIITFGGSEGSPAYFSAEAFAKSGYEALSLFFFGMENQRNDLTLVPLEFFGEVLSYIDENIEDNEIITVFGMSKGAELALNLAVLYPEIDNVILYAPTAWNYMGLSKDYTQEMKSSWTYQGEELPYIDMMKGEAKVGMNLFLDYLLNRPINYRPGYESAANNDPNSENARIKVENTDANILIFAGAEDKMWQSEVSAQVIKDHRPENTEVHIFEDAGHIFYLDSYVQMNGVILEMGGTMEVNTKAGQESNLILIEKVKEWHE